MDIRVVSLILALALALRAPGAPTAGPCLDPLPGPTLTTTGLPAPASWPVLRYEKPLKLLAITTKIASTAGYQRIARRLRASLDVRYLGGGDDIYHVNDKWIEPQKDPTYAELKDTTRKAAIDATDPAKMAAPYDVILCDNPDNVLAEAAMQDNLLKFVTAGGVLVVCGSVYPDAAGTLGKEWPAKPTPRNTWMMGGAARGDGQELAGIPVERLSAHAWIPLAKATDGATALATGEAGAIFKRQVGKGVIVFCPTGFISRKYNEIEFLGRSYDHDDIWLRLWDQTLYTLVRGTDGIPAYTDLKPGANEALPGSEYTLPAKIINHHFTGPLAVAVHVTTPHGVVVYTSETTATLQADEEKAFDIKIPIAPEWGNGLYPVYLTLGDPATKKQFQQSMSFIPVSGSINLALAAEKKGYRLGEEATFTLTASARQPWHGALAFGVYDFRGRLLDVSRKDVDLTDKPQQIPFTYKLADHGVRVDVYWAEVAALKDGHEYGRAEAKCYKYEPWSMRNEYQWSTWAGVACAPQSLTPMGMRMMAFAGMNALGYPGRGELYYAAERWGWRYYNEGIGMNTFSPVIEYENTAEIEAAMLKEAHNAAGNADLTSAAFVLGSVGEEAGFKNGWGTRYYWDTDVAPEKACKALQWYLKTKYPTLEQLNAVWKTNYTSWDAVKLTKEFSANPPKLEADGWAHPKNSPLGAGVTGVSLAPYVDTADFYNWYYDQIIAVARRILRETINPVTQTMSSAPTIGSAAYDVRLSGPGGWNESQSYSTNVGPEPGFGLIWGHFDWSVMTDNMFWGFLLTRSGHNNYWVDIPLMFNNDMSLTRSTMAMRRWTTRLAGHERIILDSKPFISEVGLLGDNGISTTQSLKNMTTSAQVALKQSGFDYAVAGMDNLQKYKIIFAVGRQSLSQQDADKLHAYVENGGTLVFTPRFASQTELGAPQPAAPGYGLAEKWSFVANPTTARNETGNLTFPLGALSAAYNGLSIATDKSYRETVKADGWTQLAAYDDKTPAILTRTLGKGRLVYLNAIYQSHWYIQWVTPTDANRQGFYRLIEQLCQQAGAHRTLRLDGNLEQVLHMAMQQFTDPTGKINYAIVRTNGEVPWTNGALHWLGSQQAAYDVLGGEAGKPAPATGKDVAVNLRPGAGKLLAFTARPVKRLVVEMHPGKLVPGQSLQVMVKILDAAGKPVPGSFPLELHVANTRGEIAGLSRSFSLESGKTVTLNTSVSDPPGNWIVTVTDGISGLAGTATVEAAMLKALPGPGFVPWGWPSEIFEAQQLTGAEFIARLQRLATLYQTNHAGDGWMAKQKLGAFYDYFPGTRHDLLRPLNDVDWTAYTREITSAVTGGATLILTGEDVNVDPRSGLTIWPHHDGKQLPALAAALAPASWALASADGDTLAAQLGKGKIILCRESIDAAGNTNPDAIHWQQRWLQEMAATKLPAIPTPDANTLYAWWHGERSLTAAPRVVTWFAGNLRQVTLPLEANNRLGKTVTLLVPPTGVVQSAEVTLALGRGEGTVSFDIGCDDSVDQEITLSGQAVNGMTAHWTEAITHYLAGHPGPYRDDNGWRLIPVRVTATGKVEVTVSNVKIVIQ